MERNLVACEIEFTGGARIGLSLGGGGTSPDTVCEGGSCAIEHSHGVIRNNLIYNCSDVGVYLNNAADSRVEHNLLARTNGLDARFTNTSVTIVNNIISTAIRSRDGGVILSQPSNIVRPSPEIASYFADQAFRAAKPSAYSGHWSRYSAAARSMWADAPNLTNRHRSNGLQFKQLRRKGKGLHGSFCGFVHWSGTVSAQTQATT